MKTEARQLVGLRMKKIKESRIRRLCEGGGVGRVVIEKSWKKGEKAKICRSRRLGRCGLTEGDNRRWLAETVEGELGGFGLRGVNFKGVCRAFVDSVETWTTTEQLRTR
ncbi:hypothetical protein ACJRO7_017793 [Eucalyptus globulus]|uniref:Uncharacterized protein n=1 Tax=Eucalyptus globulus TaxID=34317 RepID=A0ABD3KT69_EUCGL